MRAFCVLCILILTSPCWGKFSTEPTGCLEKFSPPCSILTETKSEFQNQQFHLFVSNNALFQFQDAQTLYLARGTMWFQATNQKLTVQSKFGSVQFPRAGEYWIEISQERMIIKSIHETLTVKPRGAAEIEVNSGHQMFVTYVNQSTHEAEYSVPIAINLHEHIAQLKSVFPSSGLDFGQYVSYLGRVVAAAVEVNADWYQSAVQRKVSSAEEKENRLKYEAIHNERRDSYLQKLYRSKNNFED